MCRWVIDVVEIVWVLMRFDNYDFCGNLWLSLSLWIVSLVFFLIDLVSSWCYCSWNFKLVGCCIFYMIDVGDYKGN